MSVMEGKSMIKIGTKEQPLTELEIRELFDDKLDSGEEILWNGSGYSRGSAVVTTGIVALIISLFMLVTAVVSLAMIPIVFISASMILIILIIIGDVIFPKYYVVTDKCVGYCTRGLFKSRKYKMAAYETVKKVEVGNADAKRRSAAISLVTNDNDFTLEIYGLDSSERKAVSELISSALEKQLQEI